MSELPALLGSLLVAASAPSIQDEPDHIAGLPTYAEAGLRWTRGPSVYDLVRQHRHTRSYPARGVVEVACTPDSRGRLDCEIVSEDPQGENFNVAAMRVMRPVRVAAIDGQSPEGRRFGFRLRFGHWPESLIPDRFHPVDQNLRWVRRPDFTNLTGSPARGEEVRATVNCVARADGSLGCEGGEGSNPSLLRAALESMGDARVERIDNARLEGSPLRYTVRLVNQSHCGLGGSRSTNDYGRPDTGRGATPALQGGTPSDPLGPLTSQGGSADQAPSGGQCLGSIVQMY